MENVGNYLGAIIALLLAALGWSFYIDRRLARLEAKIDLIFQLGCGRCPEETKHGKR